VILADEPGIDGPPERDNFPVAAKAIGLMTGQTNEKRGALSSIH